MATITGSVIFDRDRSAVVSPGDSGIAGIPVVLQNIASGLRLTVLTNSSGAYTFTNVPNGSYRIVLSYGQTDGVPSPGNFLEAEAGPVPQGINPPITTVTNPPAGSTNLDSLTPSTRLVTVTGLDLVNQNFLVGPVIYTPIETILDPCAQITGSNLITAADNGTFGSFPPGTAANTGAPSEPYPGVTPDFTYVLPDPDEFTPGNGEYTVQNLLTNSRSNTLGAWWRIADHTTGTETGRLMLVNGDNPGAAFFRQTVTVEANTDYLFTAWILNLFKVTGYPNPRLGVRILGTEGQVLFSETLGALIPVNTNAPEWKQIGTVLNTQNNTRITVEFLSEGPEEIGNDYAIDDISLREIALPVFLPEKTVSDNTIRVGETVEYTVTLRNGCQNPLTDAVFRDLLPAGLRFVENSVTVNGNPVTGVDPAIGFVLPEILGGKTVTVRFRAEAESVPAQNPAVNTAEISYAYTPVEGGIPIVFPVTSNEVAVTIEAAFGADLTVTKTASPQTVEPGEVLDYRITITNLGPSAAEEIRFTDTVPAAFLNPQISADGGATFTPWNGTGTFAFLAPNTSRSFIIRGIVSADAVLPLVNTVIVTSETPDPNPDNNRATVVTQINSPRGQALTDVVQSIALQETALSHILNAEGEKIQRFIAMDDVSQAQLLEMNQSVQRTVDAVTRLEAIFAAKLNSVT